MGAYNGNCEKNNNKKITEFFIFFLYTDTEHTRQKRDTFTIRAGFRFRFKYEFELGLGI